MEDKIDLYKIRMNVLRNIHPMWTPAELADACAKEAVDQALVLASKKAKVTRKKPGNWIEVDEQSILDVKNFII